MKGAFIVLCILMGLTVSLSAATYLPPVRIKPGNESQKGVLAKGTGITQLQSGNILVSSLNYGGAALQVGKGWLILGGGSVWLGLYSQNLSQKYTVKIPGVSPYRLKHPKRAIQQIIVDSMDQVHIFYSMLSRSKVELWTMTFDPKSQDFGAENLIWSGEKSEQYGKSDLINFSIRRGLSNQYVAHLLQYSSSLSGTWKRPEFLPVELSGNDIYKPLPKNYNVLRSFALNQDFEFLDTVETKEKTNIQHIRTDKYGLKIEHESSLKNTSIISWIDYSTGKTVFEQVVPYTIKSPTFTHSKTNDKIIFGGINVDDDTSFVGVFSYTFSCKKRMLTDSVTYKFSHASQKILDSIAPDDFRIQFRGKTILLTHQIYTNEEHVMQFTRIDESTGFRENTTKFTYFQYNYSKITFLTFEPNKSIDDGLVYVRTNYYEHQSTHGGHIPFILSDGIAILTGTALVRNDWIFKSRNSKGVSQEKTTESLSKYGVVLSDPWIELSSGERIVLAQKRKKITPLLLKF